MVAQIKNDIEESVHLCNNENCPSQTLRQLHSIHETGHHDCGQESTQGYYLLILIDAHSKWVEAFPATFLFTTVIIELLHSISSVYLKP